MDDGTRKSPHVRPYSVESAEFCQEPICIKCMKRALPCISRAIAVHLYAVERRSTLLRMRNTLPSLERPSTLYPLPASTA